jgi:hypothetical protein
MPAPFFSFLFFCPVIQFALAKNLGYQQPIQAAAEGRVDLLPLHTYAHTAMWCGHWAPWGCAWGTSA